MKEKLNLIYRKLSSHFGPQHWWPARTHFEVMVGAILTQNTSWQNVEKAIASLKESKLLGPDKLYKLPQKRLARFIRPTGYFNVKAVRLKEFLKFFFKSYAGSIRKMSLCNTQKLRRELLSVKGIGPETADSILLYALNRPVLVVDAYTKRMLARHRLIQEGAAYEEVQNLFMRNLKSNVKLFNEYHALFVKLGKAFCLKGEPRCRICPLK